MAEDWLVDVRKYAADADENVVQAIVRYCGIALQSRDGQLVAMSDKKERETVRENYLKKKLGLTDADSVLDDAVSAVGERMKADRTKNRVTVYYLLAEWFGKLDVFGGVAGKVGGAAAAVAATAAAAVAAPAAAATVATPDPVPTPDPIRAASIPDPEPVRAPDPEPVYTQSNYDDGGDTGGGIWGWLKWLLLALLLLALLFWLLRGCSPTETAKVADADTTEVVADESAAKVEEPKAEAGAVPAAPKGSGVVAADRDGKPMLTVYFDTGKSAVHNDISTAAANVKAYLEKNAGSKLAVSGFNDPTGNAAANAELSKNRAQAVGKALEGLGIPAASIEMVKPSDSTDNSGDNSEARRVEVTVK